MNALTRALRKGDAQLAAALDRAFAPALNPWRHLGALAFLCLVLTVVSGTIAYTLFDSSVSGAYASGLRLQNDSWLLGRLLRGWHRYGADACMALTLLHLLRELARGHYQGVRWFSWLLGLPLLWWLWIAGLTGLWLLWDERALFSVDATAQWLQALPLSADLLVRNFLSSAALNDRFFSLILFVHIGVPLLTLAAMWVHVQRITLARLWPSRAMTVLALLTLSLLALAWPAQSLGPANFAQVPQRLSLDWFFQFVHPLVHSTGPGLAWLLAGLLTGAVAALPWLRGGSVPKAAAAQVHLEFCNGCARCVADCPFSAITMVPRNDRRPHALQPVVRTDMCTACGICVGSCPSATPFRRVQDLVTGIDLPQTPLTELRRSLQTRVAALQGPSKLVVFSCKQAGDVRALADANTAVVPLRCVGLLPPSFIEYSLRLGVHAVVIAGCAEGDCEFRLGDRWVRERLLGTREPHLRAQVPRERVAVLWCGADTRSLHLALAALRARTGQALSRAQADDMEELPHDPDRL